MRFLAPPFASNMTNLIKFQFPFCNTSIRTLHYMTFYGLASLKSIFIFSFQVWFQNRRAKFRKQERLAQQKVTNSNSSSNGDGGLSAHVKSEGKSSSKDIKHPPGSPLSNVSTTPNSSASSHQSNSDIKPINGN